MESQKELIFSGEYASKVRSNKHVFIIDAKNLSSQIFFSPLDEVSAITEVTTIFQQILLSLQF
jgi:hypothetical protein